MEINVVPHIIIVSKAVKCPIDFLFSTLFTVLVFENVSVNAGGKSYKGAEIICEMALV